MEIHQIGGLGYDSNIYLIVDEVVAIIDSGPGQNFKIVKQNLSELKIKPGDVKLVIDTHCHFDHAGGNSDFVKSGAEVAIHELEADLLREGDQDVTMSGFFDERLEPINVARGLRAGDHIRLGELALEVVHTPGHTLGSICLYESKRRMLFSGDTVFYDGVGRTDLPTGSSDALLRSIRNLAELKVDKLYPGHGPFAEKDAHELILDAIELVE